MVLLEKFAICNWVIRVFDLTARPFQCWVNVTRKCHERARGAIEIEPYNRRNQGAGEGSFSPLSRNDPTFEPSSRLMAVCM